MFDWIIQNAEAVILAMAVMGVFVFVALFFVKAGYGIFRTQEWGLAIDNRAAWVLMEAPVFFVILYAASLGGEWPAASCVMLALFELHYFQRSFLFPCLMKGRSKMPVVIMLMGLMFNTINGALQGVGLFVTPAPDLLLPLPCWFAKPHVVVGIALFAVGMGVNLHSDHVIRHLRSAGDTRHYLPSKGLYRYVTSANYFGELLEWTGFAIAAETSAAWLFVWWTAANLIPRAHAIHQRYKQAFGAAVGKRKRIIPYVY